MYGARCAIFVRIELSPFYVLRMPSKQGTHTQDAVEQNTLAETCLACMFELSAAVKSGNPEEYASHLHVHVDGSCNGMQHYAAFGRDENGGRKLNLADSDRPGDVYTAILKLVLQDGILGEQLITMHAWLLSRHECSL